jgi:Arc/MetJ-type ribon-helix-helix transcriptional regulator
VALKIVCIKLPKPLTIYIDRVVQEAGASRSDFIRHAIRFCLQSERCRDSFSPLKRSEAIEEVRVIDLSSTGEREQLRRALQKKGRF